MHECTRTGELRRSRPPFFSLSFFFPLSSESDSVAARNFWPGIFDVASSSSFSATKIKKKKNNSPLVAVAYTRRSFYSFVRFFFRVKSAAFASSGSPRKLYAPSRMLVGRSVFRVVSEVFAGASSRFICLASDR